MKAIKLQLTTESVQRDLKQLKDAMEERARNLKLVFILIGYGAEVMTTILILISICTGQDDVLRAAAFTCFWGQCFLFILVYGI